MRLLEIQSSVRVEKSISRALSQDFIQAWQRLHPKAEQQQRDVGLHPPAHPTKLWVAANYTPAENRTPEMEARQQLRGLQENNIPAKLEK
jgi:FMN-dependent NADH-azoreductase